MELFENVFNKRSIYDMLFFNVKAVLQHPTLEKLELNNKPMFERWLYQVKNKYNSELLTKTQEQIYLDHAPYHHEFTKIVAITYATVYIDGGDMKRDFKKIVNEDESIVIATFMDALNFLSQAASKSKQPIFSPLCGHNIIGYDIPLLIKRHILLNQKSSGNKELPLILKKNLSSKPWESGVIDTSNIWKFNGYDIMPLMLIADYLGLKKSVDLLPLNELSEYYWNNVEEKPKEVNDFILLQSATQTNLVIQLMNELRNY